MKILLTGGAGFIGSHLCTALLAHGHEVVVVDNLSTGQRGYVPPDVPLHEVDIRSDELVTVFQQEQPEVVCHHAAQMSVLLSVREPTFDASNNVIGSLNVLACAQQTGVQHFVFASSGGTVYGDPSELPVTEDAPTLPLSPYGISKMAFEHYLRVQATVDGIPYTALRYANVYGPRQSPHGEAGVIAIFAEKMLRGEPTTIYGNGTQLRDFVYVGDVALANVAVIEQRAIGTFNIGTEVGTSVNAVYDLLSAATDYSQPRTHSAPKKGEVYRIVLDARRAKETFGWQAEVALEDGIGRTVDNFKRLLIQQP